MKNAFTLAPVAVSGGRVGVCALHVPLLFVECAASHSEIVRRLTARTTRADEISDAGVATYLRQRGEFVALNEIPQSSHLVVDTERGLEAASASITERLKSFGRVRG